MRRLRRGQSATPAQTGRVERAAERPPPADGSREMLGLELVRSFTGLEDRLFAIAWSADGMTLAAAGQLGSIGLWTQATGELRLLHGHSDKVMGFAWHPALPLLATGSDDGTVRLWQTEIGQSTILCEASHGIRGVAWSPDGRRIAVHGVDGSLTIYDAENRAVLRGARPDPERGLGLCWSRDGSALVVGSANGAVIVCSSENLELIRSLKGHRGEITDIALAPRGNVIASAGYDHTVRIWNSASGKALTILEGHQNEVMAVRFSPDGEFLASLSEDQLRLWRCCDWECVSTVPRNDAVRAGGIAFHPSQPFLAVKNMLKNSRSSRAVPQVDCFRVNYALLGGTDLMPDSSRYVNAKVILLGDTGVGKSGLGLVLSGQPYQPTDSTHGRNVW